MSNASKPHPRPGRSATPRQIEGTATEVPAMPPTAPVAGAPATPAAPAPAPAAAGGPGEVMMPTVENEAPSVYQPQQGCSILDNFEILLTYLLHLTNSDINLPPGTMRSIQLPAQRVAQLSEMARRHMAQVQTQAAPPPQS